MLVKKSCSYIRTITIHYMMLWSFWNWLCLKTLRLLRAAERKLYEKLDKKAAMSVNPPINDGLTLCHNPHTTFGYSRFTLLAIMIVVMLYKGVGNFKFLHPGRCLLLVARAQINTLLSHIRWIFKVHFSVDGIEHVLCAIVANYVLELVYTPANTYLA